MMTFLNNTKYVQSPVDKLKTRHFSIKDEISLKRLKFVNNFKIQFSHFIFNVGS